jgi:hypothetical protein
LFVAGLPRIGGLQPVEALLKTRKKETKMRRISIGIALLLLVPSISQAYYNGASQHYRVQFNPYAFNYHNNGLVPGGITYSPYAFSPRNSGLVFEGVRYTPYAFNYHSTGLVLDYYWYPIPYAAYSPSCSSDRVYPKYDRAQPCDKRDMSSRSPSSYHSRDTVAPAPANAPVIAAERQDTISIIRQYLRDRGLSDVSVNRILRVEGKLVSADFTVGGRNLLIKYWGPKQVESPDAKADQERSSTGSVASKMIEKYKKDWESFAGKYQQDGGEVYVVAASGRTDIIAALDACDKLSPGDARPGPQPVYARQ